MSTSAMSPSAKLICAWCSTTIGPSETGEDSHGICLACLPDVFSVPIAELDALPAEKVDELPYGLIRLDEFDRVIQFNLVESELARLPRERVIGRDFFEEIAPCTNVRELAGWIRDARQSGVTSQHHLSFVFDFAHGRRLVSIALTFQATTRHAHLLVRDEGASDRRSG